MRRQDEWDEHAAFMDAAAAEGLILAGGPLGAEDEAARVMHVLDAPNVSLIEDWLARDPWSAMGLLQTVSIAPWTVLLGGFAR